MQGHIGMQLRCGESQAGQGTLKPAKNSAQHLLTCVEHVHSCSKSMYMYMYIHEQTEHVWVDRTSASNALPSMATYPHLKLCLLSMQF